jgi:hypothetical protein
VGRTSGTLAASFGGGGLADGRQGGGRCGHRVRVYHFITRIVIDTGRAEDLVSDVFTDVWKQAGSSKAALRLGPGFCRSHASRLYRRCIAVVTLSSTSLRRK